MRKALRPAHHAIDGQLFVDRGVTYTLAGIYAPTADQTCDHGGTSCLCGEASRTYLQALISSGKPRCKETKSPGNYHCTVSGRDVSLAIVSAGHALRRYGVEGTAYEAAQQDARSRKAGLWRGGYIDPNARHYTGDIRGIIRTPLAR